MAMLSRLYGTELPAQDGASEAPAKQAVPRDAQERSRCEPFGLLGACTFRSLSPRRAKDTARSASSDPGSQWLVPADSPPIIRRILVPVDYSPESAECLRVALDLAERWPLSVCMSLHVYFQDLPFVSDMSRRSFRRAIAATHEAFVEQFDDTSIKVRPLFCEGASVARTIVRMAEREAVDLIVMTARTRSRSAALLLDSRAAQVICDAPCPILVLQTPGNTVSLLTTLFERIAHGPGLRFS
jgi:nucleotide-binding universal stress UspA family protein